MYALRRRYGRGRSPGGRRSPSLGSSGCPCAASRDKPCIGHLSSLPNHWHAVDRLDHGSCRLNRFLFCFGSSESAHARFQCAPPFGHLFPGLALELLLLKPTDKLRFFSPPLFSAELTAPIPAIEQRQPLVQDLFRPGQSLRHRVILHGCSFKRVGHGSRYHRSASVASLQPRHTMV